MTDYLKQQRKLMSKTHQQVADAIGIERSTYTRIENGDSPHVTTAKKIGGYYGFKWYLLYSESGAINESN